jgi:hypothetical protein
MDGRVATELAEPDFWRTRQVRRVPAYAWDGSVREGGQDEMAREQVLDGLRTLGYIR